MMKYAYKTYRGKTREFSNYPLLSFLCLSQDFNKQFYNVDLYINIETRIMKLSEQQGMQ